MKTVINEVQEVKLNTITLEPFYPHIEVNIKTKEVYNTKKLEYINIIEENRQKYIKVSDAYEMPILVNGIPEKNVVDKIFKINISKAIKVKNGMYKDKFCKVVNNDRYLTDGKRLLDLRTYEYKMINKHEMVMMDLSVFDDGAEVKQIIYKDNLFDDYYANTKGFIYRKENNICYSSIESKNKNYKTVTLTASDKSNGIFQSTIEVHSLVINTFKPDEYESVKSRFPNEVIEIDHIDSNTHNNQINNLQFIPKSIHKEITRIRRDYKLGIITELPSTHKGFRLQ
ncbi:hypothetical protein [Macrococcus equipercicus]|uniref:HNH nuclease domain-containing protein n=1 Tax=Macrococcus equipercicus TaxID=69967 RepID=A0A9Q9F0S7_9STAP|nr:hypothetical protein [Macrococcus equipercicus]UTH13167.1 hypothetical protein KFV11_07795 [Macrococcus equipercicus]